MSVREMVEGWMVLRANTRPAETEISDFAGRVRSSVQNVTAYIGYMVTGRAFTSMADGVRNLAASMVQLNAQYEQQKVALTAMVGSQEMATELMADLEKMAAKTPFSQETIISSAQALRMYGFEAKSIIPMLTQIGDAAAASPEGMEFAVHRIVRALGQMRAKGRVMTQELNQLTEAGVPALLILQQKLGVTGDALAKMIESGQVSAGDGIRMILEGLSDRFGGMMEKQSQSLAGLISTAKDFGRIMLRDIGEPIFELSKVELKNLVSWAEGGGFDRVREFAGYVRNLTEATVAWARGPGGEMAMQIGQITVAIGGFLASGLALKALLAAGLPLAMSTFVGAANAIYFATSPLGALMITTAGALGVLAAAFVRSSATGETFAEAMTNVIQAMTNASKVLRDSHDALNSVRGMSGQEEFVGLTEKGRKDPSFVGSKEDVQGRIESLARMRNEYKRLEDQANRARQDLFNAPMGSEEVKIAEGRLKSLQQVMFNLRNAISQAESGLANSESVQMQNNFLTWMEKKAAAAQKAADNGKVADWFGKLVFGGIKGGISGMKRGFGNLADSGGWQLAEMFRLLSGSAMAMFSKRQDEHALRMAERTAEFGGIADLNRSIQSRIKVDPSLKVEQDQLKELKEANKKAEKVEAAVKEVARGVGRFVAGFAS